MDNIVEKVDLYWRAANYLSLARLYLKDNPLLNRDLCENDLKTRYMGHWGVCPSLNFIYSHLNYLCKKHQCKIQLVVGSGHGGNALLSNLFLEGSLQKQYDFLTPDREGLLKFLNIEEELDNMRAEINPLYPGTIYDGGELGYSLAVAFGSVLDYKDNITVCVIGDGEAETGTLCASWNSIHFMRENDGYVLPIINLNGYKMGSRSILSNKTDDELRALFRGLGYEVIIVNARHEEMIKALDWVWSEYKKGGGRVNRAPMIILKSPKGWTAPQYEGENMENNVCTHKNPIMIIKDSNKRLRYLRKWLLSYKPNEFFDCEGAISERIKWLIPDDSLKMGRTDYRRIRLHYPNLEEYALVNINRTFSNMRILLNYFKDFIYCNCGKFRIMSPDELASNRLGELATNNYSMEILNENICQGWMQGYNLTGRNSIMIAYEAFMPIIGSMLSQYIKFLVQAARVEWRKLKPSMNYILTSVCWENTYSHQNPEFVCSLLLQSKEYVKIYFPIDANTLLVNVDLVLQSEGLVNVITVSKRELPQFLKIDDAHKALEQGYWQWVYGKGEPDIILIIVGDHCLSEMFEAVEYLRVFYTRLNFKIISIIDVTKYSYEISGQRTKYSDIEQYEIFQPQIPRIILFHGYQVAIPFIFNQYVLGDERIAMGYKNNSMRSDGYLGKMKANECSRYDILYNINRMLYEKKKITEVEWGENNKLIEEAVKQQTALK